MSYGRHPFYIYWCTSCGGVHGLETIPEGEACEETVRREPLHQYVTGVAVRPDEFQAALEWTMAHRTEWKEYRPLLIKSLREVADRLEIGFGLDPIETSRPGQQ